jgi:hypothetical protein
VELAAEDYDLNRAARTVLGVRPEALDLLATIKHSLTRYRITLEAYRITGRQKVGIATAGGRWLGRARLKELAFTSAHKQIVQRLGT